MKLGSLALAASISIANALAEKAPTRQRTLVKRRTLNLQRQRATGEELSTPPTTMASSLSSMSMSLGMSADMCAFCPGGLSVPELVIIPEDQVTCSIAKDFASTLGASDPTCAIVLKVEAQCCPQVLLPTPTYTPTDSPFPTYTPTDSPPPVTMAPNPPPTEDSSTSPVMVPTKDTPTSIVAGVETDVNGRCNFCPIGLINPDLVFSLPNVFTCADAIEYALTLTPDNSDCENIKGAEFLCCPAYLLYHYNMVVPKLGDFIQDNEVLPSPPTEDTNLFVPAEIETEVAMCNFCPVGLIDPNLVFSLPNAFTCAGAINYTLTLEADSSDCENMKGAEFLCCPAYLLYHYNMVVPKLGDYTRNSFNVVVY